MDSPSEEQEQREVGPEEVSGQLVALIERIMNIAPVGKNLIKVTDCAALRPSLYETEEMRGSPVRN